MTHNEKNIEEMINAYLDGELSDRELTEFKRLADHDTSIGEELLRIARTKELISSATAEKAPEQIGENLKMLLERKALLAHSSKSAPAKFGQKHLITRKVLTAAAILLPIAVLAAVVFNILMPAEPVYQPQIFAEAEDAVEPVGRPAAVKADKRIALTSAMSAQTKAGGQTDAFSSVPLAAAPLAAELSIETASSVAVNKYISKAIYINDLLGCATIKRQAGLAEYSIDCANTKISDLLYELRDVWPKFAAVSILLRPAEPSGDVRIANVSVSQAIDLFKAEAPEDAIALGRSFAVLNSIELAMGFSQLAAADTDTADALLAVPKPTLTSPEADRTIRKEKPQADNIKLTIKVYSSN